MFDTLFGEGSYGLRFLIAFVVVIGLIALTAWLVRRFGGERLGTGSARGRQPRLAVIDAATVDGRRRLVLIRRDNVEHLLIIGGPTDVVVEQNIVRAVGAQREAQPPRAPSAADTLPRPVPLNEGTMWPLQPEPAQRVDQPRVEPAPRLEAAPRGEVAPRPPRAPAPPPMVEEEEMQWDTEPEPPVPPPIPTPSPARERRARVADPLAGLAEELARTPISPEPTGADAAARPPLRREPRPVRPQTPPPPPVAAPAPPATPAVEPPFNSAADQNLAQMAQRLEAALRRPARADAPPPATRSDVARDGEPESAREAAEGHDEERTSVPAEPARAGRAGAARPDAKPAPQKSLYDSLEQEMASLLGRPNSKP
jgi:flagellar protein FliO/FliZ